MLKFCRKRPVLGQGTTDTDRGPNPAICAGAIQRVTAESAEAELNRCEPGRAVRRAQIDAQVTDLTPQRIIDHMVAGFDRDLALPRQTETQVDIAYGKDSALARLRHSQLEAERTAPLHLTVSGESCRDPRPIGRRPGAETRFVPPARPARLQRKPQILIGHIRGGQAALLVPQAQGDASCGARRDAKFGPQSLPGGIVLSRSFLSERT